MGQTALEIISKSIPSTCIWTYLRNAQLQIIINSLKGIFLNIIKYDIEIFSANVVEFIEVRQIGKIKQFFFTDEITDIKKFLIMANGEMLE